MSMIPGLMIGVVMDVDDPTNQGRIQVDLPALTGRSRSADFETVWPNSWSPESAGKARVFMDRFGVIGLLLTKFHTTLRSFAPLASGAQRQSLLAFLVVSALSSALWSGVLLAPRYLFSLLMSV